MPAGNELDETDKAAWRQVMRYSFIAASGLLVLFSCATTQQLTAYPGAQAYPQEQGVVCAVKAGDRQNYWTARAAQLNGALVIFKGECPAAPNSEGFMG
jgi:hypothetical protein